MDSLQEVSSTMTEDADVVSDIQSPQPQNGISLAEAANALITLQVPAKTSAHPIPVSSSKNGETNAAPDIKPQIDEVNSKDFRKRILEGMKSQFNTNAEEQDETCEPSSRRVPPHRAKSKFKRQDGENEEGPSEAASKVESPNRSSRGRGRPPKGSQPSTPDRPKLLLNVPKKEAEPVRATSERDSSSEAGSERSDSASSALSTPTTRRSQRTNISRTSATDLLKGLAAEARPAGKKTIASEPEMAKPAELPRKRGRPARATLPPGNQKSDNNGQDVGAEDDVSKMEHMASLGLLSKCSPELSTI